MRVAAFFFQKTATKNTKSVSRCATSVADRPDPASALLSRVSGVFRGHLFSPSSPTGLFFLHVLSG